MVGPFQREDSTLSDESKRFLNSLPSTFSSHFRKHRHFLPAWTAHTYCLRIKSTFLVYHRASRPGGPTRSAFWQQQQHARKYLDLQLCTVTLLDVDHSTHGFVISLTLESSRTHRTVSFAAASEKHRAQFAAHIAAVQHQRLSLRAFTTLKLLGRGHYGRVVLASRAADPQLYAIKEMKLGPVKTKVVVAERAVMEWASGHPFVLGLEYALARGRSVFLVSKFMQGGDLFGHLRKQRGGRFPEAAVRFYAAELLLALEHLHRLRIVHRDVKPENVLLDSCGHVKLADMGLAKQLAGAAAAAAAGRTTTACGTDMYLPPEMAARDAAGHGLAVDLWQCGCLVFELATGSPPFFRPQSSRKSLRQRILYAPVQYPDDMSPELKNLVAALLEKRQEDRLGYDGGMRDVCAHAFFKAIDWDSVYRRQLEPPLVPGPPGEELVANFDAHFTGQPHTIYAPDAIASCLARDFVGFDYVRPAHVLSNGALGSSRTATASTLSSRASTVKDVRDSMIECSYGPVDCE
ncbi:unnamed protein product [Hyaloperonospora brassicae]|uniref:non-specific serine/threonine protein kinase n=1 Tax=Hyaloperonospora brassicae TaxID=162125 RepID=A0AAV0THS9_HYABA|nr:unnamed protein product [Hyaloperonospora brassicae]